MKLPNAAQLCAGLLLVASCADPGDELGRQDWGVVNGSVAREDQFPAVVMTDHCTMTRIGARHFLTAAHCMNTAGSRSIRVGSAHPRSLGTFQEDAYLTRKAPWDGHNTNPHQYDLAVVTISPRQRPRYEDLTLLAPIGTLPYADTPPHDEWVTVVGYGDSMHHGFPGGTGVKRFGTVYAGQVAGYTECERFLDPQYRFEVGHAEFVHGSRYTSEWGVIAAPGDSGGPYLRDDTVVGVVSAGWPNLHIPSIYGQKFCSVASRLDVAFVDSIVNAPIIDGISETNDVDPSIQHTLPTIVFKEGDQATLVIKGYRLMGTELTWSDGTPVAIRSRASGHDAALQVDTLVLSLETTGQPDLERNLIATHPDSPAARSVRAVRFECSDERRCGGKCVDLQRDTQNCGACGNACGSGEQCEVGLCFRGDPPPRAGESKADPHLVTFDGFGYGQQQDGEFILAADDRGMVVQVRQERWYDSWTGSANTAVAVQAGAQRVAFYSRPEPRILVDGAAVELTTQLQLADGSSLDSDDHASTLRLASGDQVRLVFRRGYVDVEIELAPDAGRRMSGLLGNANGNIDDDLTDRDGSARALDGSFANIMAYAESWRIRPEESLFDYEPGESSAGFDDPRFPLDPELLLDPESPEYQAARDFCSRAGVLGELLLDACAADYLLTGDSRFVESYLEAIAALPPLHRSYLECTVAKVDRTSCEACCDDVFGEGPHSPAALADASLLECMCLNLRDGACATECAGECGAPDVTTEIGSACQQCLDGHPVQDLCASDPALFACMASPQCMMGQACPQNCPDP